VPKIFFNNSSTEATGIPEFLGGHHDFLAHRSAIATTFDVVEIGPNSSSPNRFDFASGSESAKPGIPASTSQRAVTVRQSRTDARWVLLVFGLIGLLDAYLPAYTDRTGFWTMDGEAIRWLGVALFAGGGALRIWPIFVLGHRFSRLVAIQRGHTLVTDGIFGVIRNPSYLGMLILTFGWALAFRSWSVCCSRCSLSRRWSRAFARKKGLLRTQFGDQYEAYLNRTSRMTPRTLLKHHQWRLACLRSWFSSHCLCGRVVEMSLEN
jgi:protein-S-isoprenylcysteine O-methyltransferase Ste14